MHLRKARNPDVSQIRALINEMAARTDTDHKHGHMLPRSLTELYEHIRDYTVIEDDNNRVMGCCALESQWDGLAELKALAVHDELQGQGWGRKLVAAVLAEAPDMGIGCVYTLTNKITFFEKLDFAIIPMHYLPQRVWSECVNCPKYDVACDEVAMTYRGCRPKQIFIPAVGVNAPAAARAALGLPVAEIGPPHSAREAALENNGFLPPTPQDDSSDNNSSDSREL
jgi:amino-acid N-acetyltransferase